MSKVSDLDSNHGRTFYIMCMNGGCSQGWGVSGPPPPPPPPPNKALVCISYCG